MPKPKSPNPNPNPKFKPTNWPGPAWARKNCPRYHCIDTDLFFVYTTGTMITYDRFSL